MKLAVLFSGGKDSAFAMFKAMQDPKNKIACLISVISKNNASYMFHTPNILLTKLQAKCIGIPLIEKNTQGEKEEELKDLEDAIKEAMEKYKIEGIVTGAIASNYQKSRIEIMCNKLKIKCINPLWHKNQIELLQELVKSKFKVIIVGVFAYPLNKTWLGKEINAETISSLYQLAQRFKINPSGEGGEIETLVVDCPIFKKSLKITSTEIKEEGENAAVLKIKRASLAKK